MPDTVLVLNAGSSSIKFQLFEVGEATRLTGRSGARSRASARRGRGSRPRTPRAARPSTGGPPQEAADVGRAQEVLGGWLLEHLGSPAGRGRPPGRARRPRLRRPGAGRRRAPGPARGAGAARPAPPAEQPGADPLDPRPPARAAAGRLLRHRLPPRPPRAGRPLRHPGGALPRGRAPLRLPRPVLRVHRLAPARGGARHRGRTGGRGPPGLRRCSACAMVGGRSVESTMGFTALDGLPMGTRPGQLDPGVVLYLAAQRGMAPADIERLLYHDCGLKGLSGGSNDVRDLLASEDPRARLALDYLAYRTALAFGVARRGHGRARRHRVHGRRRRERGAGAGGDRRGAAPGWAPSSTRRATLATRRSSPPTRAGCRSTCSRPTRSA